MSEVEQERVPLRHRISGRMPSVFAQNVLVNAGSESVTIAFFETITPLVLEFTPEIIAEMKETGVLSECVARISMPKGAFLQAVRAFSEMAEKIQKPPGAEEVTNV